MQYNLKGFLFRFNVENQVALFVCLKFIYRLRSNGMVRWVLVNYDAISCFTSPLS